MDQIGDGADLDVVFGGKRFQFSATRHGAVIIHHFADHAGRLETGHARQIARSFRMACAGQGAAGLGHQGEDMAGADNVVGLGVLGGSGLHGTRAVGSGNAGGHAFSGFDGNSELGAETRTVARRHQRQFQGFATLAGHRHADEATGITRHEVDVLGLDALGGHDQIAFVLAIFVIHEDDHLALADVFNQFFDAIERHSAPPSIQDLR